MKSAGKKKMNNEYMKETVIFSILLVLSIEIQNTVAGLRSIFFMYRLQDPQYLKY
jgi:hypothetical protein